MKKVGETIRKRRLELGLKVYELAKKVKVNPVYITQIEKHNKLPSFQVIYKIQEVLRIDLSPFYLKEKYPELKLPLPLYPRTRNYLIKTCKTKNIIKQIEATEWHEIERIILECVIFKNPVKNILKKAKKESLELLEEDIAVAFRGMIESFEEDFAVNNKVPNELQRLKSWNIDYKKGKIIIVSQTKTILIPYGLSR